MADYGINGTTLNLEHLAFKCKNAEAWSAQDVLIAGEFGIELDTKKYKLGDGVTAWPNLAYYSNPVTDSVVSGLTERVTTAESTLTTLGTRMDAVESGATAMGTRMDTAETNITSQGTRLGTAEGNITTIQEKDTAQDGRLDALEGITTISANSFSSAN